MTDARCSIAAFSAIACAGLATLIGCEPARPLATSSTDVAAATRPAASGRDERGELEWDGRKRTYKLRVPPDAETRGPLALVLMLHGGLGNSDNASKHYGWSEKADAEGFLVAYPDGTGSMQTWNAVHCCGSAQRESVDDVGFLAALIDRVAASHAVDRRRVYATGMSNGAMMCYRLAAERPELLAAIAPVAGSIGGRSGPDAPELKPAKPARPVPVVIFHGTDDQHVLFDGGKTVKGFGNRVDRSVEDAVRFWVEANGCDPKGTTETLAGGQVRRTSYAPRANGAEVVLYAVVGQGHAWPGGLKPRWRADEPSRAISATDTIWEFFRAHARR